MERNVEILNELNGLAPVLAMAGNANIFAVPEGYFETVPAIVTASIKNEVPAGYFDNLPDNILSKIEGTVAHELNELSPLLAGIKKENPFAVPEYYFEQAASSTVANIWEEKTPAVLEGINKLQPYRVPVGYFDGLAANIASKAKENSGAKIVAMPKRRFAAMKYAAAAVFTGIIALGVYKYAGKSIEPIEPAVAQLAKDEMKFEEALNNLNEEDIIKYLEKNGSESDVASLASGIDENTLPSQEEYFTDEEALDKFLDGINTNN